MKASSEKQLDEQRLDEAVRTRSERRVRGEREARRSIGQDLAMVGVLGWTVVIPTLLGVFVGRWLDRKFESGIFFTLGLLVAGVALGCVLAWQRLQRE
jgi:ATP synthase protein I